MTKEEDDEEIIERLQRERQRRNVVERRDEKEEEDSFLSDEEKNDTTKNNNNRQKRQLKSFTMPANATKDFISDGGEDDQEEELFYREKFGNSKKISDRENEYKKRRFQRQLSPERGVKKDSDEQKGGEESKRGYKEAMREQMFAREKLSLIHI